MANKCPFISARGACGFEKKVGYECPLLQSDDLNCHDLTDGEFMFVARLHEARKNAKR